MQAVPLRGTLRVVVISPPQNRANVPQLSTHSSQQVKSEQRYQLQCLCSIRQSWAGALIYFHAPDPSVYRYLFIYTKKRDIYIYIICFSLRFPHCPLAKKATGTTRTSSLLAHIEINKSKSDAEWARTPPSAILECDVCGDGL